MFIKFNKNRPQTDLELVAAYQKSGDNSFVGTLFERYTHLVYGVCLKYLKDEPLAKDFTLEIFEVLLDKLQTHEISNFSPWLHQVSKNHCLMYLRKQQSLRKRAKEFQDQKGAMESDVELHPLREVMEKEAAFEDLESAIKNLKEEQQKCIRLFYLDQMSYEEVAGQTGYSLGQVKSYIQNGKRNLKIQLDK